MDQNQNITPSIGTLIGFYFILFIVLGVVMFFSIMQVNFPKTQDTNALGTAPIQAENTESIIRKQKFEREIKSSQDSYLASDYNGQLQHAQNALVYADSNNQKAMAQFFIANGYLSLNNFKQADLEAKKGIDFDPNYANTYSTLALAQLSENDLDSAFVNATKALQLKPSAERHNILGIVLQAQGKKIEAINEFQAAVDLDPQNSLFRQNLLHAK